MKTQMSLLREYSSNPNILAYRTIGPDEARRRFEQWRYYDEQRRRYNTAIPAHIDPYYNYHNYFPEHGGVWPAEWGTPARGHGKYTVGAPRRRRKSVKGSKRRSARSRAKPRRGRKRTLKKKSSRRRRSSRPSLYKDYLLSRQEKAIQQLVAAGVSPLEAINEIKGESLGKRSRVEEEALNDAEMKEMDLTQTQ